MSNHLYSVTLSSSSSRTLNSIRATLPQKYWDAFRSADVLASCYAAESPRATFMGSAEMYFSCDATLANALRKWFQRRYGARSKFARTIVPVGFCVFQNALASPPRNTTAAR
jgi:hypothetical protein